MVVHNPNNWHWVDKNCLDWAKKYFNEKLVGLETVPKGQATDSYAVIDKVSSVEGDCEVNQRKGKVISLFDLKLVLSISGNVSDDDLQGSITVPEVAFDSDPQDYQFEISIFKETSKLNEIKPEIRSKLIPQLREIFSKFGEELLSTHANDIQESSDKVTSQFTKANQESSLSSKTLKNPVSSTRPAVATASTATPKSTTCNKSNAPKYNTTTLHIESAFQVPAIELYRTLLDKRRIEAWSRSPLQCTSPDAEIQLNEEFTLFGGNITMKYVSGEPGKSLVFDWRLNDWKQGHFSRMNMSLHESNEYHETKLVLVWSGVPIGEEDKVRNNFEEYYVRSIKITFGFGAIL